MLIGGLAATKVKFSQNFMAAMQVHSNARERRSAKSNRLRMPMLISILTPQHLGGGVVIAAVALEIIPKLTEASPSNTITVSMVLGYAFGVAAMLALKALSGEDDDDAPPASQPLLAAEHSRRGSLSRLASRKSVVGIATSRASEVGTERGEIPWHLFVAVGTDSFMDGLLVGIALIAGEKAGLVLALAMAIEMGFLGTVFSASLQGCSAAVRYIACVIMPALIICMPCVTVLLAPSSACNDGFTDAVGGVIGHHAANALAEHESLFVFILAFGAAVCRQHADTYISTADSISFAQRCAGAAVLGDGGAAVRAPREGRRAHLVH